MFCAGSQESFGEHCVFTPSHRSGSCSSVRCLDFPPTAQSPCSGWSPVKVPLRIFVEPHMQLSLWWRMVNSRQQAETPCHPRSRDQTRFPFLLQLGLSWRAFPSAPSPRNTAGTRPSGLPRWQWPSPPLPSSWRATCAPRWDGSQRRRTNVSSWNDLSCD